MLRSFSPLGCVEDLELNIRWDSEAFAQVVARRAAVLAGG
jgi:hypothetical protein